MALGRRANVLAQARNKADAETAKAYPKLVAMARMSPAEVGTYVDANVVDAASMRDAIKTLTIGFSILARKHILKE